MMRDILFLCGGRSEEHEISLISAKCALDALDRTLFKPIVVGISRKGVWHLEDEKSFYRGEFRADKIRLNEDAPQVYLSPFSSGKGELRAGNQTVRFDAVFPILHGPFGEDGTLQGLLEMVGVPFVGSGCGASWICMDKVLTKTLCKDAGILTAPFVTITSTKEIEKNRDIANLGFPLFVKPARLGSSVGITKVEKEADLEKAVVSALKHGSKVLVEKGIQGREIECAVLGTTLKPEVAPPGEIIVSKKVGWYSYEAKYLTPDGAETVAPAKLDSSKQDEFRWISAQVFTLLECDGLARIDFFLESTGKIYLNEVNTMPGFTPISMYPRMWQTAGLSYSGLITKLIELAFQRV